MVIIICFTFTKVYLCSMASLSFLQLLVHPTLKTPLYFHEQSNTLSDEFHQDSFPFKEGVPILLPPTTKLSESNTSSDTFEPFDYKAHYQLDAAVYDYTETSKNTIELAEINRLHQQILHQIPLAAEWILDVGCGGAWLAKMLTPKGRKVISMDISDINPIRAKKTIPHPSHEALVADVFALPFAANSIDCIVASEIIEHVPDPKAFVHALFQVLKPGGKLIITTPYNELIRTSLCIHCNKETPHNAHLHSFTEAKICNLFPTDNFPFIRIFNSKLLVKMGIQSAFRFLPLWLYQIIEQPIIYLTGKRAYRLIATQTKKG
ncbi:MAG: methyltransferase domain-containing protein [Bacteroidetes bacterium]|nr:methyltransferase domain-containing protein [Bacteroidota bacterium]